jgi:cytochrome c-type biogenesis protein CcmH
MKFFRPVLLALTLMLLLAAFGAAYAQTSDAGIATDVVTDDQVNNIAKKLYCPVCENITLDTCGTAACADWRYEIRIQLEAGMTETQIVEDFVRRFGDRVVGTPLDPVLRALSLITPWVLIAGMLVLAFKLFTRHGTRPAPVATAAAATPEGKKNSFRELLEQDLKQS